MAHLPRNKPGSANEGMTRRCNRCRGSGLAPCAICGGRGQVPTGTDIQGRALFQKCSGCVGRGTSRCTVCSGQGFVH